MDSPENFLPTLARFTAQAGLLPAEEIDEILEEDILAS